MDVILQGRVGDATEEEKICTTTTENEKEWVRARATLRTAVTGVGAGAKTTTTEAAVEKDGRRRRSGHRIRDNTQQSNRIRWK